MLGAPAEIGTGWHVLVADPVPPAWPRSSRRCAGADGGRVSRRPGTRGFRAAAARRSGSRGCATNWRRAALDGFIVPRADEHQGEYVPPRGQRLAWLTGFTGSAGLAVVLARPSGDVCRWPLHAAGGAAGRCASSFEIHHLIEEPPARWLETALAAGAVLGYDPWLHTPHEVDGFAPPQKRPGRRCARSPTTRSTVFGRVSRRRRWRRSWRIRSALPARTRNRSVPGSAVSSPRRVPRQRC